MSGEAARAGVHSARPLIPCVVWGWWGPGSDPARPTFILHWSHRGRIQSPPEAVVGDQRTGESVVQGQDSRGTEQA
jgi:hypothetical protein